MGQGGNKTERVDIVDSIDPRVVARAAQKGTLYRYIPAVGDPIVLIKQADGYGTDWIAASGTGSADTASNLGTGDGVFAAKVGNDFQFKSLKAGTNITLTPSATEILIAASGGAPTGDANTLAYFNAGGNLSDNTDAKFFAATNSCYFGITSAGGIFGAGGVGAFSRGNASAAGLMTSSGVGSTAYGSASNTATMSSSGIGSTATGEADSFGSSIASSGKGSFASGYAVNTGSILASGIGALALGQSDAGVIQASSNGAIASGYANPTSVITASGSGSHAIGHAISGGSLTASGLGAFVTGQAIASAITASSPGSSAMGFADSFAISSGANGTLVGGWANTGVLQGTGYASIIWGDDITSSARNAQTFGQGNYNESFNSMAIGRFADFTGQTAGAYVSTDIAFVIGNGTAIGVESNAYQVDKDGRQVLTAAEVNTAIRMVAAAAAISARTDYAVVFDTAGAGGALTLPVGINGQKFLFMPAGVGAAVYTLTAGGADLFDASVTTALATGVTQGIMFLGGTWYSSTN